MASRYRSGFSLVEILAVMISLPIFFILISKLWVAVCQDMPASTRLVARHRTVLDAVQQIHQDVSAAGAIPLAYGPYASNDANLLVQMTDKIVLYQRCGDVLTRQVIQVGLDRPEDAGEWYVPDASIRWNLWEEADCVYAVELRTHVIHRERQRHIRLQNAHVFFLAGLGQEGCR
jgi:type II secretory pathway component PulJ